MNPIRAKVSCTICQHTFHSHDIADLINGPECELLDSCPVCHNFVAYVIGIKGLTGEKTEPLAPSTRGHHRLWTFLTLLWASVILFTGYSAIILGCLTIRTP